LDRLSESQRRRRIRRLAQLALLWALIIVARLGYLQILHHADYARISEIQSRQKREISALRGRILDRTSQTLAISVPADTVVINPRKVPDLTVARDLLCPILGLDARKLQKRIDAAVANHRGYLVVKARISPEESKKIRSLHLDWIEIYPDSRRFYPAGPVAAAVIGSVNHRQQGNSGLELKLNPELTGTSGVIRVLRDARQKVIDTKVLVAPKPGADIGISIDERIQFVADRELKRAAEEYGCRSGSVVVMNPHTGEVLAMASYPAFNPNARVTSGRQLAARTNQAVSVPFEPGSVFKVITLSAALETTNLRPSTLIECGSGVLNLFGRRIHDLHAYGTIPMEKVLAKSSNIGAIQIALRVGEKRLLDYVRRFGFGRKTGIPLPAESAGKVRNLDQWKRTSIGSVAMGHEISATSLQLAQAACVIANGGLLRKPRLILWRRKPDGKRVAEPAAPAVRVLRAETAISMRRMMEGVVLAGTGRRAKLVGYSSGGKTGSAQIFDFTTRHYVHRYNASFVGFAPVADPAVVVSVTLNDAPKYGGIVAAPVFREVAQTALRILGTVPDVPPETPLRKETPADLAIAELGDPSAPPVEQMEEEPLLLASQTTVSPYVVGPRVPDFRGKTLRAVLRETSRLGVGLEYTGAGVVRAQYPPPGTVLPAGEQVRVEFRR